MFHRTLVKCFQAIKNEAQRHREEEMHLTIADLQEFMMNEDGVACPPLPKLTPQPKRNFLLSVEPS
jgi:hypothetical protein